MTLPAGPARRAQGPGWTQGRRSVALIALVAVMGGCGVAFRWWGEAPDVAVYLAFVLDRDGAYKADRVTVAYVQHGRLRWARYALGYRFGTADATPLP